MGLGTWEPHRMQQFAKRWLRESEACEALGITSRTLQGMARSGSIAVMKVEGMQRGTRYSAESVAAIAKARETPAFNPDGEGFDLNGAAPDWIGHRVIDRADYCWMNLLAYGYLNKADAERIRMMILADVVQCGAEGKFKCATSVSARRDLVAPTPMMGEEAAADEERRVSIPPWEG